MSSYLTPVTPAPAPAQLTVRELEYLARLVGIEAGKAFDTAVKRENSGLNAGMVKASWDREASLCELRRRLENEASYQANAK